MVHTMGDINDRLSAGEEQYGKVRRSGWIAFATGLHLAFAVCYVICKPPQTLTLSWGIRLRISVVYLLIACFVGALGTWIALPHNSRVQLGSLLRCGVRGWIFLPAIMLFLRQSSVWAQLLATLSAMVMALYSLHFAETAPRGVPEKLRSQQYFEQELFSTQIRLAPTSWVPFDLSLGFYGAFLSAVAGRMVLVTLLLAASTFLLVLQITEASTRKDQMQSENLKQRFHLYFLIAMAFCSVFIALSASSSASRVPLHGGGGFPSNPALAKKESPKDHSAGGYHIIVLWPPHKEDKIIPSFPRTVDALSAGVAKPWIIPFYGPYWYFKFSGESPGSDAQTTRGDPLKVNVRSTDSGQLLMEAHQNLSAPIDLACCSEMQVVFRNDMSFGAFAIGLSLTDSQKKLSQSLGVKYVAPISPERGSGDASPLEKTLIFALPKHGSIQKFDAITVALLPDAMHLTAGRKVAVERFVMIPR
jgi:hypothetical protein